MYYSKEHLVLWKYVYLLSITILTHLFFISLPPVPSDKATGIETTAHTTHIPKWEITLYKPNRCSFASHPKVLPKFRAFRLELLFVSHIHWQRSSTGHHHCHQLLGGKATRGRRLGLTGGSGQGAQEPVVLPAPLHLKPLDSYLP